jgi:serine/threonine protein kinase
MENVTYNTINDSVTMAGAQGTLLANRYRIVRQLGQGGMGSVWLAEDTQLDNKQFAVKMLPSILVSNKRAYRQLKDEALVAMKLTHPNIVTLRAFEENNGNPFLVMDYIDGETLDDYLAEHDGRVERVESAGSRVPRDRDGRAGSPLPAENGRTASRRPPSGGLLESEVIRLLTPIAAALDYAHSKGVVHRDVKPGNVMIAKDGTPYILDFGIAREIQETMTRVTGKLSSGTLLYMSPEQLNGDPPRKEQDVYSFAAMAYECLKGEPPFSRGQIEFQILNNRPQPLPTDGLTGEAAILAAGVMQGLAKKPEDRPPTCAAVLSDDVSRVERVESDGGGSRSDGSLGKVFAGLALLAALAGGGVWWMNGHFNEKFSSAQNQTPPTQVPTPKSSLSQQPDQHREDRIVAEDKARKEAIEIHIEAKVWQSKMARISDADGFGNRKNALSDLFVRAEAHFDDKVGNWSEAAQGFTNYVVQCEDLQKLNDERLSAIAARDKAAEARRRADGVDVKEYAETRWREAERLIAKAGDEFGQMRFTASGTSFASAAEQFEKCVSDAKAERARQARSLVGKWRGLVRTESERESETSIFYTTKEFDFLDDGTFSHTSSSDYNVSGVGCKSVCTWSGDWVFSGRRLTIHVKKRNTQTFVNDKVTHSSSGGEADQSYAYEVLWRPDGTVELRLDIGDLKNGQNSLVGARYESDGTLVQIYSFSFSFQGAPSISSRSICKEAPNIYKRVSD